MTCRLRICPLKMYYAEDVAAICQIFTINDHIIYYHSLRNMSKISSHSKDISLRVAKYQSKN